jgi:hypothetical protein
MWVAEGDCTEKESLVNHASIIIRSVVALSLLLFVACSGDSGSTDAGSIDAKPGSSDAALFDAGEIDGGGSSVPIVVPQCVSSGYQIMFRGLIEPMDPLLRYLDTPIGSRDASQKPDIVSLSELKDVPDVYSRFTWYAKDVPGVVDTGDTFITADFGFDPTGGSNPAQLDNGISGSEVVIIPWEFTVAGPTVVGAGRMSVIGLDNDVVRITIVANDGPEPSPWYEGWANYCRFKINSFSLHLDLATPGSEPYAVIIGYEATGSGFAIENGSIVFGTEDSASFTGNYNTPLLDEALPFDLEIDFGADPATVTGTFAGGAVSCTVDLETFQVSC